MLLKVIKAPREAKQPFLMTRLNQEKKNNNQKQNKVLKDILNTHTHRQEKSIICFPPPTSIILYFFTYY